jgi:hypothetical protein
VDSFFGLEFVVAKLDPKGTNPEDDGRKDIRTLPCEEAVILAGRLHLFTRPARLHSGRRPVDTL